MPHSSASFELLSGVLSTLRTLLERFQKSLGATTLPGPTLKPPNALSLLHDSASLLRAQITKLSLLLLNKPFTASAIASIITSFNEEILPSLMAVDEICRERRYSHSLHNELRAQLHDLLAGLLALIGQIPKDETQIGGLEGKREEILKCTGHVWQTCDRLIRLADMGIVGLAVEKAEAYYALLKDAVEEVEGWDPDEEEDDLFGENNSDSDVERKANGVTRSGDTCMNGKMHSNQLKDQPPGLDALQITNMQSTKDSAVKALKLVRMLYPAVLKRRISSFPPFTRTSSLADLPPQAQLEILDQLLLHLHQLSEETDEMAGALYGGDPTEVGRRLEALKALASKCLAGVKKDWGGKDDEFSIWSAKWVGRVGEVTVGQAV
ncbi:MAG: hypothetical protein Q9201_005125 [Fulgogasparrea decipioides]